MKKRLLTVLLAVLMIVSLLPSMAFASEVGCTRTQKVTTITDGETYQMNLSGKNKGDFTFEASGKNWNIKNSDGRYLNAADGKLVLEGAAETAWTYSKGAFSISEKTTQKNNGYWWGWMWIPGWGSKTVTTTYYLSTVTNGAKLSTSCVSAELYKTVSGDHDYDKAVYVDKTNHKYVCRYCGDVKTEAHSYDGTTHKCVCGAYDPAESSVKISVDVKEKTTKQYIGWWPWGYYKTVTTYTAAIKTDAKGVKVTKVQYQMNGGRWMTGTCVSSEKPIESLKVKAWDNNGNLYEYEWPEEVEKQTALYTYVYENKEPYDYIKDATVTFVTGEAECRTFTGETDTYGFAAINVPRNVEGTLTISKDGYVTKTKENVTYTEATAEEKFWLDIAKSEIKITLAVSGEGAGHFEDVWAPGAAIDSVEFESGKYFSNNENGYFYIADDASGTGVHPYQFVADEGSEFAGFDPNKATYEAITTGFTLTANAEKMQTVTFHAGTADEIAKGAIITGAAGKWNVAADSRSAYRSYRTSELNEEAIKAEGSASVEAVYEGYSVKSWTKAASTWDYYPAWEANNYNVTAQVQGDHGTATVKVNDVEVSSAAYASNVVFSATPNAGYEFDHWEVVSGGIDIESSKTNNPISLTMPSTALTLKAHFKAALPATYNIIVEDDGHGTASADPTSAAPGATVTLTATPNDGYAFKSWQIERGLEAGAITDNSFTMPSKEVKVKAVFEKEYAVEVEAGGHGSVSADVAKGVSGKEVNLTITPDAGYEKDQITVVRGGVTVTGNKFNIGTADVKIRVTFKAIVPSTYGIIVEDDGHGTAKAQVENVDATSAAPGDTVNLTAKPNDGYAFKEWQIVRGLEAGAITDNSFTMPSKEVKVKAVFEKEYAVEAEAGGHGTVSADVVKGVSGKEVNLTIKPDEGYEVDQITVVRGGVTVVDNKFKIGTADVKIRVTFKAIVPSAYGIIVEADGHGTAKAQVGGADVTSAAPGAAVTLVATANDGYAFKEWQIERGLEAGAITDNSFTMPSSEVKVKAIFERVYNITLQTNEHGTVSATVGGKTATTAAANAEVALIATPYEGYKFKEWKVVSGDVEVKDNKFTMPAKNVTIQAVFVKTFKVTFDLNGVTGTAPEAQTVEKGGMVTRPDVPTFEGHSIEGWYTTKDDTTGKLSGKWDFDNDTVTANMTLYAQWQTTISTILETTDSIPTYENFKPKDDGSWFKVPKGAWVTEEGNKAFKGQLESGTIFNLGCCITDTAYYLSLDDTEPFLLCGNTYVWTDGYFGTMTCYMTDGVFTSLTFAGNNQKSAGDIDFSSLNGTYTPPKTVADILPIDFPTSYAESNWKGDISAVYKIFYKDGSLNVSTDIEGSIVSMAKSENTLTKNDEGYEYTAENSHKVIFVMDGTTISSIKIQDYSVAAYNNTYTDSTCIAAGTMISMPGGRKKVVEELEIGDVVCTFDHETGEVSSAPVCFIWESKNVGNAFTLTFEGDIEVTVIEEHGFYDKEEQKYVFINLQNAQEYIGDHFYHADSNNWLELKSCKVSNERVDAYAIITSGDLNHMSNGMLSMCDGTVKMIANIFEYDDRMRYDADKKKADIETYGLTPIEKILEFDGFIEADYVDYNLQYLNVAIGKGLTTWERIKALSDYCVANGLVCIEQTNDVPMLGTEEMEPIIKALDPRSKPESCEPEKLEEAMPEELIEPAEAVAEEAAP